MASPLSPTKSRPAPPPSHAPLALPGLAWAAGLLLAHAPADPLGDGRVLFSCLLFLLLARFIHLAWRRLPFLCLLSFAAGFAWTNFLREEPVGILPAEDFAARIEVTQLFAVQRADILAGTGIIRTAIPERAFLEGTKVSFYLDYPGDQPKPIRGEWIRSRSIITSIASRGERDGFEDYLASRGIFNRLYRGTAVPLEQTLPFPVRLRNALYQRWVESLGDDSPGATRQFLTAMLLGESRLLPKEWKEVFKKTGTLHFFAISGLHIGILVTIFHYSLKGIRLRGPAVLLIVLALVWTYIAVTGARPSAIRAGIFVSIFYLSLLFGRQRHPFAALVNAGWLVLLVDPRQIFQPGFQLSYGVVTGLILFTRPVAESIERIAFFQPFRKQQRSSFRAAIISRTRQALSVSLVASVCSSPLVIAHFEILAPVGILLNILLGLLVFTALAAGVAGLILATINLDSVASLFFSLAELPLWMMSRLIGSFSLLPGASQSREYVSNFFGPVFLFLLLSLVVLLHIRLNRSTRLSPWLAWGPLGLIVIHIWTGTG